MGVGRIADVGGGIKINKAYLKNKGFNKWSPTFYDHSPRALTAFFLG